MRVRSRNGEVDDLRAEYDLRRLLKGGVLGKYAARCRRGTNLVRLDPEVARAFPTETGVNQALRLVIRLTKLSKAGRRAAVGA